MNIRLKRALQVIGLLALLPAGAVVTVTIASVMAHKYDDGDCGIYHGVVQGRLSGQQSFFYFTFKGRTEPQWRWARPENYAYKSLELEWHTGESDGKGVLNLRSLTVTTETGTFALSEASIAEVLRPKVSQEGAPTQEEVAELYSLLAAAAQGELPPPRHHPHRLDPPLYGSLSHLSVGLRLPYALFGWALAWLVIVVAFLMTIRKSRRSRREGAEGPLPHLR